MSNIVVSFTTSPTRIHKCLPMIQSICQQTVKPDLFLLNIPDVFARTGESYVVPNEIAQLVTIHCCEIDYGPGTKLIPTIDYLRKHNYSENTRILYCDDDVCYQPNMLESVLQLNPRDIWAGSGFDFVDLKINGERRHEHSCTIAEGYMGVSATLSMFTDDFMPYIQMCCQYPELRLSDDIMLSNYYAKHNITIRICAIPGKYSFRDCWQEGRILNYGNMEDALHNGASGTSTNNIARYLQTIQKLNRMNPTQRFFRLIFFQEGMPLRVV